MIMWCLLWRGFGTARKRGFIRIGAGGYGHPYCGSRNLSPATVFRWAVAQAARKKPELDYARVRLEPYGEGLCVQMLHMGPYSREQETVDTLAAFLEREGLVYDHGRRHHEIYLSDPRRCAPERLKTVLRLPVKRKIV